jgi:hypothetical protein
VKDLKIGYFPALLFSNMITADKVGWGGLTVTHAATASPAMGSGVYPDGDFKKVVILVMSHTRLYLENLLDLQKN